jgi:hypothetical protein
MVGPSDFTTGIVASVILCTHNNDPVSWTLDIPSYGSTGSTRGITSRNSVVSYSGNSASYTQPPLTIGGVKAHLIPCVHSSSLESFSSAGHPFLNTWCIIHSRLNPHPWAFPLFWSFYPLTLVFLILLGWTLLPDLSLPNGTRNRLRSCAGCHKDISAKVPFYQCHFCSVGFTVHNIIYPPCNVRYHLQCIRAGPPFTSRHADSQGLSFPSWSELPIFICEWCTVQAHLRGKCTPKAHLTVLLMLERMRLIDMAHS